MPNKEPTLTMAPCYYCNIGLPAYRSAFEEIENGISYYTWIQCDKCGVCGARNNTVYNVSDTDAIYDVVPDPHAMAKMYWNRLQAMIGGV